MFFVRRAFVVVVSCKIKVVSYGVSPNGETAFLLGLHLRCALGFQFIKGRSFLPAQQIENSH